MVMESSKKFIFIGFILFIFFIIGIVAFIGGFFIQNDNKKFIKTAEKTSAVITDINETKTRKQNNNNSDEKYDYDYDVFVSFVVNGVTYKGNLGSHNSDMRVGDSVTIYYNPKDPNEFMSLDGDYAGYIIVIFGFLFTSVSIFFLINNYKDYKEAKEVEDNFFKPDPNRFIKKI